jgi:hypothetical protein
MYVPRSALRWTGWTTPRESVALAITVQRPAGGVRHSYSHNRHAFAIESPSNRASFHVWPESTLTSTRAISPVPVHAAP